MHIPMCKFARLQGQNEVRAVSVDHDTGKSSLDLCTELC